MVNDEMLIAEGTKSIFDRQKSTLILGLTGRTGSGCTTVAGILSTAKFSDLDFPAVNNPTDHELRKSRIVRDWLSAHWHQFRVVQISHILTLAILDESIDSFIAFADATNKTGSVIKSIQSDLHQDHLLAKHHSAVLVEPDDAEISQLLAAEEFYFSHLKIVSRRIKDAFASSPTSMGGYTTLFQSIGDNIRKSGKPYLTEPSSENLFSIPRTIEKFIALGRRCNQHQRVNTHYFVIDALRHPYEITYLKESLPRFYCVAIVTEENSRKTRLERLNYTARDISSLDRKEYPDAKAASQADGRSPSLKGYDRFVSQNIQACLEQADIFITNPTAEYEHAGTRALTATVCRYLGLMQHPGLVTPTAVERCMQAAFAARLNSGCISRQVGAVITDKNHSIKAVGWNDAPKGQVPCTLRYARDLLTRTMDHQAFSDYENSAEFKKVLTKNKQIASNKDQIEGRRITYCFKDVKNELDGDKNQVHTRSLHAEENAFLQVVKYGGQGIENGFLFSTASPCELCAKKAAQLGITKIYYIDPYPGITSSHVLGYQDAPKLTLFTGAIGAAYHQLYTPIMAYKNELKLLVLGQQPLVLPPKAAP